MGTPGSVDIADPKFPIRLNRAWHAQATYLVNYGDYLAWEATFPTDVPEMQKYGKFLPDEYQPSLVDTKVQLTFFYVNHIESDLGSYLHAGIIVRAIPKQIYCAYPGYFIGLEVVDTPFTWYAGYKIWGYRKVLGRIHPNEEIPTEDHLKVTVYLPDSQPSPDDYTYENVPFSADSCRKPVFTLSISKPATPVLPYARDVYSHTLRAQNGQAGKVPTETRFRRNSYEECVQPRSTGARVYFHSGHPYGQWLGKLAPLLKDAQDDPLLRGAPEVRWAPHMSGEWNKPETIAYPNQKGSGQPNTQGPARWVPAWVADWSNAMLHRL